MNVEKENPFFIGQKRGFEHLKMTWTRFNFLYGIFFYLFFQDTQTHQVCKMTPEQVCEKKRVNPRVVEKKMMKKFCRKPKKESYFDQYLMAKLQKRAI